jgi:hypothetical protein
MKEKLTKFGKNSVVALAIVGVVSIALTVSRIFAARKAGQQFGVELDHGSEDDGMAN